MAIAFSSPSRSKAEPLVRRGGPQDIHFIRSLLAHAYGWHVNVLETELPVGRYVEGFGRLGDSAFVWTERGHRIGAGWYRLFDKSAPGYGFVDDHTPELTVAVVPSRQRQGIGEELLRRLLDQARAERHPALAVSVHRAHPDLAVYERAGFAPLREDGKAITLLRRL